MGCALVSFVLMLPEYGGHFCTSINVIGLCFLSKFKQLKRIGNFLITEVKEGCVDMERMEEFISTLSMWPVIQRDFLELLLEFMDKCYRCLCS